MIGFTLRYIIFLYDIDNVHDRDDKRKTYHSRGRRKGTEKKPY